MVLWLGRWLMLHSLLHLLLLQQQPLQPELLSLRSYIRRLIPRKLPLMQLPLQQSLPLNPRGIKRPLFGAGKLSLLFSLLPCLQIRLRRRVCAGRLCKLLLTLLL